MAHLWHRLLLTYAIKLSRNYTEICSTISQLAANPSGDPQRKCLHLYCCIIKTEYAQCNVSYYWHPLPRPHPSLTILPRGLNNFILLSVYAHAANAAQGECDNNDNNHNCNDNDNDNFTLWQINARCIVALQSRLCKWAGQLNFCNPK